MTHLTCSFNPSNGLETPAMTMQLKFKVPIGLHNSAIKEDWLAISNTKYLHKSIGYFFLSDTFRESSCGDESQDDRLSVIFRSSEERARNLDGSLFFPLGLRPHFHIFCMIRFSKLCNVTAIKLLRLSVFWSFAFKARIPGSYLSWCHRDEANDIRVVQTLKRPVSIQLITANIIKSELTLNFRSPQ